MKVHLISHTPDILDILYTAAKTCYSSKDPFVLMSDDSVSREDKEALIKKIIASGHQSVLEHCLFTFSISEVSRACTHQLVRHRLASYSQQSQRYVIEKGEFQYVIPRSIEEKEELKEDFEKLMKEISNLYQRFIESGVPSEDARFVLPSAVKSNIIMSMNARELLHFFTVRCCSRAQWEIRELAWKMLSLVQNVAGFIFEKAGPNCVDSSCLEGSFSCGNPVTQEKRSTLLKTVEFL